MNTPKNLASDLTIVIPARNEEKLIPLLLFSLAMQDYPQMHNTKVVVADAASTDGTVSAIKAFSRLLNVNVISGGRPSAGRNAGAALADTPYILFLDADIELASESLIRRALELAKKKDLDCVTTNILCRDGSLTDKILYAANDLFQYLSLLHRPFSTGMFMLFKRERFMELGGFHQDVHFAEDYMLSQQVARKKFGIVRGGVYTTNRRFQKMGHLKVAQLFLATAFNFWNQNFFLRDHKYWEA